MSTWTTMRDLATGDLVTESDMDALRGNILYLLDPNKQSILYTGGDKSTTSTSFVDVDATNASITLTTNGGPVLVSVSAAGQGTYIYLDVTVDGVRLGSVGGLTVGHTTAYTNLSFAVLVTGLAAGSHTFRLQWRVTSGTGVLFASTGSIPLGLSAIEL